MKPRTDAEKKNQSIKMKAKWRKAEKFAKLLGKPKEECFNNMTLIEQNQRQIAAGIPYFIEKLMDEGKWGNKVFEYNSPSEYVRTLKRSEEIMQEDREKFKKEKAEILGDSICSVDKNKDTNVLKDMEGVKQMMWVIGKIGSLEKAKKILQAIELLSEASK